MDQKKLDQFIQEWGKATQPPRPILNLSENVWREIRLRKNSPSLGSFLTNLWTMPRWALAGLAAASLCGIIWSSWEARNFHPYSYSPKISLGLDAFSATAPHLPSTLLVHQP